MKKAVTKIMSFFFAVVLTIACIPVCTLAASSGTCGSSLKWSYNSENATLTITGSGSMTSWSKASDIPWKSNLSSIKKVVIGSGVTSVGKLAFCDATAMTSVSLPDTLTKIEDIAFWGCKKLNNVVFPDSLTSIGAGAFMECFALTSISIPASVTNIGKTAFDECKKLGYAVILANISAIPELAFSSCTALKSIYIPASVTSIASTAFLDCGSLKNVYYFSTKSDWSKVSIGTSNDDLKAAAVSFATQVNVNYKQSKKLSAAVSEPKWLTTDSKTASIGSDGTVTGLKKGTAVIVAVSADGTGSVFSVNVSYSLWQTIIRYLLFGWIWYK